MNLDEACGAAKSVLTSIPNTELDVLLVGKESDSVFVGLLATTPKFTIFTLSF